MGGEGADPGGTVAEQEEEGDHLHEQTRVINVLMISV